MRYDAKYCSMACWGAAKRKRYLPVGPVPPSFCVIPESHPARLAQGNQRIFVEGPCAWCGDRFCIVDQLQARYCSKRCARSAGEVARGRFRIPVRDRLLIYERDRWICQLCGDPVDKELPSSDLWAATLDHVVPQSWQLIPDHSEANLRLAHRWCNSVRGNESYYTEDVLKAG